MKKLMILGGSRYILPVIEIAHELNIYVITCDYLPGNIAHKYSDEYCNVSIIDKEAVLDIAKKLEINGIMSFACDPGVVTAAYVAEKMGLPSCGPYKSVEILQNKKLFRNFLKENGFNVPNAKGYSNIEEVRNDSSKFNFPVMVKPVDSAGSKGVTRVDHEDELEESVEYALKYSHSNEIVIEEFIEKRGCSSDSECFSVNGELKFVSFSSQRFDTEAVNPYTPAAFSWPSTFTKENEKYLTQEIQRLLKLLNMNTSIYNVETREATSGIPYIMEVSPRGGGNRLAEMIGFATGENLILAAIKAALGEKVIVEQKEPIGYWAEIILHSEKEGCYDKLWIADEIMDSVVETDVWVNEGEKVDSFTGANKTIGTIILKCDSKEKLENIITNVKQYVNVKLKY